MLAQSCSGVISRQSRRGFLLPRSPHDILLPREGGERKERITHGEGSPAAFPWAGEQVFVVGFPIFISSINFHVGRMSFEIMGHSVRVCLGLFNICFLGTCSMEEDCRFLLSLVSSITACFPHALPHDCRQPSCSSVT